MEQDILEKFEEQEKKLEAIYKSTEKTRRYFLWTLIITVLTIILPLIALAFVIPWFLNILSSSLGSLLK
jgi:membrane protein YqaA with SNARE-associated domain